MHPERREGDGMIHRDRSARVDELTEELAELRERHPSRAAELDRHYRRSLIFHENALEGVVLTEEEIHLALDHHLVADASLMHVVTLIRNHEAALRTVEEIAADPKAKVTAALAKQLFDQLQRGVTDNGKPMLRKEMPLHRAYFHEIAQPGKIEEKTKALFAFAGSKEFREYHPVKQAAWLQWHFLQAFPYNDHNGRIARLLGTIFLLRGGLPPVIVHAVDRQRYYDALKLPLATLRNLLVEQLVNSLANSARFLTRRPDENLRRIG